MRSEKFKEYRRKKGAPKQNHIARKGSGINQFGKNSPIPELTIMNIVKKLSSGLSKFFIALKYQVHKSTGIEQAKSKKSFPWFKVGIVGLIVFLFIQKDFQFSINMKAPENGVDHSTNSNRPSMDQELNVAQAVAMSNKSSRAVKAKDFDAQSVNAYIHRFNKVAKMEMKKFGIPASIKMAWGILESQAGQSTDATNNNNHFGNIMRGQPFTTSWENWRVHSILLKEEYANLFDAGMSYKAWAKALNRASIPGSKRLGDKLLQIIDTYQLKRLDEEML